MQLLPRLWATTLIVGCGVFAGSAHASLETGTNYSALPKDQIALNEYTGAVACTPVEPHYLLLHPRGGRHDHRRRLCRN